MKKKQHIDGFTSREYVRMLIAQLTGLQYEEQESIARVKEVLNSVAEDRSFYLELGFFTFYRLAPGKIGVICTSRGEFGMRDPSQFFCITADYQEHNLLRVVKTVINRGERGGLRTTNQVVLDQTVMTVSTIVAGTRTRSFDSLNKREQLALLSCSVNDLELTVRGANFLNNENITTLGQLVTKTRQEMLEYRNFGRLSLKQLEEELSRFGLRLGMKPV